MSKARPTVEDDRRAIVGLWIQPRQGRPESWRAGGSGSGTIRKPNQPLQQTAAAISVLRDITAHHAAAAAELFRSASLDPEDQRVNHESIT
jgi:hypothetical protein